MDRYIVYKRLVNMGFITVIKDDNVIIIDVIIDIIKASIIAHTSNEIDKLKRS